MREYVTATSPRFGIVDLHSCSSSSSSCIELNPFILGNRALRSRPSFS